MKRLWGLLLFGWGLTCGWAQVPGYVYIGINATLINGGETPISSCSIAVIDMSSGSTIGSLHYSGVTIAPGSSMNYTLPGEGFHTNMTSAIGLKYSCASDPSFPVTVPIGVPKDLGDGYQFTDSKTANTPATVGTFRIRNGGDCLLFYSTDSTPHWIPLAIGASVTLRHSTWVPGQTILTWVSTDASPSPSRWGYNCGVGGNIPEYVVTMSSGGPCSGRTLTNNLPTIPLYTNFVSSPSITNTDLALAKTFSPWISTNGVDYLDTGAYKTLIPGENYTWGPWTNSGPWSWQVRELALGGGGDVSGPGSSGTAGGIIYSNTPPGAPGGGGVIGSGSGGGSGGGGGGLVDHTSPDIPVIGTNISSSASIRQGQQAQMVQAALIGNSLLGALGSIRTAVTQAGTNQSSSIDLGPVTNLLGQLIRTNTAGFGSLSNALAGTNLFGAFNSNWWGGPGPGEVFDGASGPATNLAGLISEELLPVVASDPISLTLPFASLGIEGLENTTVDLGSAEFSGLSSWVPVIRGFLLVLVTLGFTLMSIRALGRFANV